jgi:anaerobic selenocysteine-containing dehydrogenase
VQTGPVRRQVFSGSACGLCQWLIYALNLVTGNLDRAGGAMFPRPAFDLVPMKWTRFKGFRRWRSRVRGLPEFDGELPAAAMAEEIQTPGEGQIRALLTVAGNPVLSAPNGRRLEEALSRLDFMVAIDFYLNETTRHAHLILPPTANLEHDNYDLIFHLLAIRNTARFSPALFTPAADARHDWEILLELQTRLLAAGPVSAAKAWLCRALLRRLGPEGLLDLGLRFGPYGSGWRAWENRLTLRRLKRSPHGIDLGPLLPCLPERLCTASKRIELAPAILCDDLQRLRTRFFQASNGEANGSGLVLIGRRDLRSNNSWMHNSERLMRGSPRCTLLMHSRDGARLGIVDGQQVRVNSRVASIEATVELSEEMMPGVVSLPHGWGHTRGGTVLRTAQRSPGVSVNDVTDELSLDALCGNAAFSGTPVEVAAL